MKAGLYKDLDFKDECGYYTYIINSYFNGQKSQMNQLYKNMDDVDKKYFIEKFLPLLLDNDTKNINEIKNYLLLN